MAKATHYGHCQACGSRQKLPGGVLAKHGYTTRWGFFYGVCVGSGRRPFETHTDLIEAAMESQRLAAVSMRNEARDLLAPATTPRAWFSLHVPSTWAVRQSSSRWIEVDLTPDANGYATFERPNLTTQGERGTKRSSPSVYGVDLRDLLAVATAMNASRAAWLENEAKKRDEYVAWQRERLAAWVPQPLVAVA